MSGGGGGGYGSGGVKVIGRYTVSGYRWKIWSVGKCDLYDVCV